MSTMHNLASSSSKSDEFTTPTKDSQLRRRIHLDSEEEKSDESVTIDTKDVSLWLPYDEEDGVMSDCWSQPTHPSSRFEARPI